LLNENWDKVDKDTMELEKKRQEELTNNGKKGKNGYGDLYMKRQEERSKSVKKSVPRESLNLLKKKKKEKDARKKRGNSKARVCIEAEVSYENGGDFGL
jgi:hypothetical protein